MWFPPINLYTFPKQLRDYVAVRKSNKNKKEKIKNDITSVH